MKASSYYTVVNNLGLDLTSRLGGSVMSDNLPKRMVQVWDYKGQTTSFFYAIRKDENDIVVKTCDGWSQATTEKTRKSKHFSFENFKTSKEMAKAIVEHIDTEFHALDGIRYC